LYGMDGSSLRVADTPENRAYFGGHQTNKGISSYPLLRIVTLHALRSRLIVAAQFGPWATGERSYAKEMWARVPNHSVILFDRGFTDAAVFIPFTAQGEERYWLTRANSNAKWKVIRSLGPGDDLVEINVSADARSKEPTLPRTYVVRAIHYQKEGFEPQT